MKTDQNFFVPEYIQDFKCIGKDCIDSCCIGWNIPIDKNTFDKYENSTNRKIKAISKKFLVKNESNSNLNYGKFINQNGCCPLLSKEKLCSAFNSLGQDSLSVGCSTFPRVIKIFNKEGFISGRLSCPEIARLCLSKRDLKIKKLKSEKLPNIFNSQNILSLQTLEKLPDKKLKFIQEVFSNINDYTSFFDTLKKVIIAYDKITEQEITSEVFSKKELKKVKENLLLTETHFFAKICFSSLVNSKKSINQVSLDNSDSKELLQYSRYKKICKKSAVSSKYFFFSNTEFLKEFIYVYNTKFEKFRKQNNFIFKNYFLNEFLKNIEYVINSKNTFDHFIREIIFYITLTNFLLVCQLFEDNKQLTIDDYVEVLSAVIKHINHSDDKTKRVINFFRKFDKNNLFRRLIDLY